MHLFFLTRGIKHARDRMVEQLASVHFPMDAKDKDGKIHKYAVQAHLQPIELWSYVFPKEHLDTVLRTLNPAPNLHINLPEYVKGKERKQCSTPSRSLSLAALRKALKLKKIPSYDALGAKLPVYTDHMHIIGLGIKDDYNNPYGNEAL